MCGITACIGGDEPVATLLDGLDNLEYRGYDSAGIAVLDEADELSVRKREGQVSKLAEAVRERRPQGTLGIGHTRWSTHGPPSDENAHPHTDCTGSVAVVHNGIIENYGELREHLQATGHTITSDTDTEVLPHLIESHLENGLGPEAAFRRSIERLEGSYAVAMVVEGCDTVFATRSGSPLVVGVGDSANYLASDVPAFIEHTDEVVYLEDGDVVEVRPDELIVTDIDGEPQNRDRSVVEWNPEEADKGRFDHYMRKEINEQPTALRQAVQGRVDDETGAVALEDFPPDSFTDVKRVRFVACGTSYHAALYAAELLAERGVPAEASLASEFLAGRSPTPEGTLVVGVTQSGETADTLQALREANARGRRTLAVTNVVGSTAARECDDALFIRAGPEIGVAATKTFSSQIATLGCLADRLAADVTGTSPGEPAFLEGLQELPEAVDEVVETTRAREIATRFHDAESYFFIGRGTAFPVALEGALKLKEISYEHAEGFAAGELKHGPLALVTSETPVFAIATGDHEEKMVGNVREIQARGAPVVAIAPPSSEVAAVADDVLDVPEVPSSLTGVPANVHLQLFSYHVASLLERPIDKPRNLAKSVTVE